MATPVLISIAPAIPWRTRAPKKTAVDPARAAKSDEAAWRRLPQPKIRFRPVRSAIFPNGTRQTAAARR